IVMSLGTDTSVAIPARHVVEQDAVFHLPWSVLRIGERIEIDNGGTYGRGDVHRPGIVRYQYRRAFDERGKDGQRKAASERMGPGPDTLSHGRDEVLLGCVTCEDNRETILTHQPARCLNVGVRV